MDTFNPKSPRAQKSRIALVFKRGPLKALLSFVVLCGTVFGALALVLGQPAGFLALEAAVLALIPLPWNKGELSQLKKRPAQGGIDGLLAPKILARLKSSEPSAFDVW